MHRVGKLFTIIMLSAGLLMMGGCKGREKKDTSESGNTEIADTSAESAAESSETETAASETEAEASEAETETTAAETETVPETTASPNIGLTALASVPNYVNVRKEPSVESEIIGKIYNDCAAEILDETEEADGNWFRINSGNVNGYIKAEFFLVGEAAEERRAEVGVLKGIVNEDYLRVRSAPDLTDPENVFTFYERGTEVFIKELTEDGWAVIESDESSKGYVYAECLLIDRVFKTAITIEEEEEMIAKKEAAEEAARQAEEAYQEALRKEEEARKAEEESRKAEEQQQEQPENPPENQPEEPQPVVSDDTRETLRNAVVAYALQFVGNPYVHGGRSLQTGTDCSGFTSLVYQNFGYFLDYTPAGQAEQGVRVDLSALKPGDLLFYSNSQKYLGHVAMYIGNGQIVHAGNEDSGIFVGSAYYRDPLFAIRIIN